MQLKVHTGALAPALSSDASGMCFQAGSIGRTGCAGWAESGHPNASPASTVQG